MNVITFHPCNVPYLLYWKFALSSSLSQKRLNSLLFPFPHHLFFLINLFIFGCIGSSLLHRLSLVVASGGYSSLRCAGFLFLWLLLMRSTGSRHASFSSCGTRAQLLRGMWDVPGPGLEPMSTALAGRFSTTAPPGKSPQAYFLEAVMKIKS